ncbi:MULTISPECIES: hypothetical protein [Haloarcula]|uniref:Uncharacterized protein n=1 Tax=Haloarcula pellucida TaxID=1427151 RepID=A0A830GPJ9_9EURY|nr:MULTISPECIES: hypothetical protein [Halomicroarcula]MBX0349082.1 hypothetical protein [Halomicroarcula pellucida]MDS0279325.1 hypothetical protein [Halomicroarcula sp. S1AR25-4]GGN98925.1 hypothetical protein GCM10009030_29890 [Halomicroarcula pellucida]
MYGSESPSLLQTGGLNLLSRSSGCDGSGKPRGGTDGSVPRRVVRPIRDEDHDAIPVALDEPAVGVDPDSRGAFYDLLYDLNGERLTLSASNTTSAS